MKAVSETSPKTRAPDFRAVRVDVEKRQDKSLILRNTWPLQDVPQNIIAPMQKWAQQDPERLWLAKRSPATPAEKKQGLFGQWENLTYASAYDSTKRIATALLKRGMNQQTPLMILSGNSSAHALMAYGAMAAGVPVAPVSVAYSLVSSDYAKLRYVYNLIQPAMIFVENAALFGKALAALNLENCEVVSANASPHTSYQSLLASEPDEEAFRKSVDNLTKDMVARYMFTSGSTGMPKAVITPHGMLCANAAMTHSMVVPDENLPFPIIVNWLPWNHCYGSNAILNVILAQGGTLYIDDGRPLPGAFSQTIQNLKEISPTTYSNVPAGFAMLVEELEKDSSLAKKFFERLRSLSYGGAALGQDIYERLQQVAVKTTGEKISLSSGYGATETGPTVTNVHWVTERMGLLGLPLPGVELKLAPVGDKMEVRVKGDSITPGYFRDAEKTKAAFDDEGFYCLGDAARFVDDKDITQGLVFDGRIAEDFKLSSGTWVSVGKLRIQVLDACGGLLSDAVITGLDQDYIGILGFTNKEACNAFLQQNLSLKELANNDHLKNTLAVKLQHHNKNLPASSTSIKRAILLETPPSIDDSEITDKGYINQSACLTARQDMVKKLYDEPASNNIIII